MAGGFVDWPGHGLRWPRAILTGAYRYREERIGTLLQADERPPPLFLCPPAGLAAAFPLGGGLELGARYDLSLVGSNVDSRIVDVPCLPPDFSCHQLDYGSQSFHKHVPSVSLSYVR